MDLNEGTQDQRWEEMKAELYTFKEHIDFSKINDDDSQAKLILLLMNASVSGLEKLRANAFSKIDELRRQIKNLGDSKENHDKIEAINLDIEQIRKDILSCTEIIGKIDIERNELVKKFWIEDWEAEQDSGSDTESDLFVFQFEDNSKKREPDSFKQERQKLHFYLHGREMPEIDINKLSAKNLKEPEEYSPFNDPDNKFGWKEFCNTRNKLWYQRAKARNDLLSLEQNKTVETQMNVINDKQSTPPCSGDNKGTESKDNSLSSLNSCTESKDSSARKDSGVDSDQTSTSLDKKKINIDYSKVKNTLERFVGTIEEKQQHSLASKDSSDANDGGQSKLDSLGDYKILINRALLDFCERHLLHPPDDYLLLGLGYVRFKQTNIVLRN